MKKALLYLALACLLALSQSQLVGAVFTVTNNSDALPGGGGSLRQVIQAAASSPGPDTINFDPSVFTGASHTINFAAEIVISDTASITIDASAVPSGVTINGANGRRLFAVASGSNATFRGLTFTGGNGSGATSSGSGGALLVLGTATVDRCTFSANAATGVGGAIRNDGALVLTQSTFAANQSNDSGGAIANTGTGSLALTHCTISANTATNVGGGVFVSGTVAVITNSIVSGNTAGFGADTWTTGPSGGITRTGANIISVAGKTPDAPDNGPAANTADPLLGALADNGGPNQTMALLAYSQAIDAVPGSAVDANLLVDQRGFPRLLGASVDLGAYESGDAVFTSGGLTLFGRLPAASIGSGVFFEISDNAAFSVPNPIVSTLSGTGGTYGAANGPRSSATYYFPSGVAQDSQGNIFIADAANNVIRMLGADAVVSTVAGSGLYGRSNGPGLSAAFAFPSAVAVGPDDNVYVADTYNHRICKLTRPTGTGFEWTVSTLAGTGTAGFLNGAGSVARFNYPYGLDVDGLGNVYVADSLNHRIRKITPAGVVSSFAGNGTAGFADNATAASAQFNTPQGLVIVSKAGFPDVVCVADRNNHRIRQIATTSDASGLTAAAVSTLAGSGTAGFLDNNTGTSAQFSSPSGVAADSDRNLYIADEVNNRIRKVTPAGVVTTVAGSGTAGYQDGIATSAQFQSPTGVLVARDGTLVVADNENHTIRSIAIGPLRVPAIADPTNIDGFGEQLSAVLDFTLLGLSSNVRYYFRYRLPDDTTVASGQSFIQIELPAVTSVPADNLTPTAARLKGTVNPRNLPTTAVLEYSVNPDLSAPYAVTTRAGTGAAGFLDSATPTSARFHTPRGLVASGENLYVADSENHRIRKIGAVGAVSTFAGSGVEGFVDGTAATARFDRPAAIVAEPDIVLSDCSTVYGTATVTCASTAGLAVGASISGPNIPVGTTIVSVPNGTQVNISAVATGTSFGLTLTAGGANFYVADEFNHCIRKITAAGQVTTLAGSGIAGFANGAPGTARFLFPSGVALDTGVPPNLYVADSGNHCIRRVAPDGTVTTFAGTGASGVANGPADSAQFANPRAVAVNADGAVLVADTGNHLIRLVSGGTVGTYAGSTQGLLDGPIASAKFNGPNGIAIAPDGSLFVSDSSNHVIREISADGQVSTFAGSGTPGAVNSPASGLYPLSATQFNLPAGIALDSAGSVYVSQEGLVRKIAQVALPTLAWPSVLTGTSVQPITRDLSGLLPGFTYYFRAKGTCLQAVVSGNILSFATPAVPIRVYAGSSDSAPELINGQAVPVDFGSTPRGTPLARTFTIINPNGLPITVTSVNLPAGYQLTAGTGVNVVPAGGSLAVEITLLGASGGTKSGTVTISSDAPGLTSFAFPILGVVIDRPVVTTAAADVHTGGVATLNGTVNPQGATTAFWFQWSLTGQFDGVLVNTLAGSSSGYAEGTGTGAKFNQPYSIASDGAGVLYVADTNNHRIRRIASNGAVTTFAGTGVPGFADGPGVSAQFNSPTGIVFSGGTLFVADSGNNRIRAITSAGQVRTYSGSPLGEPAFTDGVGTAARFSAPWAIAADAAGILYVADRNNQRVRKVALDGSVSTLVGNGTAGSTNGASSVALLDQPIGIAVDASGAVYVTEAASHAIRKITPDGFTSLFAGSATTAGFINGSATDARFAVPKGLAVDRNGSLYIADSGNHSIRKITSTVNGSGTLLLDVATFAGLGSAGSSNGLKDVARFDNPVSVVATVDGTVFVGELTASTIRTLTPTEPLLPVATGLGGTTPIPMSLDVTDLVIGATYYYRSVATNASGTTYGSSRSVLVGTPFELWQLAHFGPNADPIVAGAEATPAHDGIANRLKYALGLDPFTDSVQSLPPLAVVGGSLTLTYNKVLSATDILYRAEWSSDLINWTTVGITEQVFPPSGATQQVIASVPISPDRTKFIRLTATFQ